MPVDLPGIGTKYEIEGKKGKIAVVFLESGGLQLYIHESGCESPCCIELTVEEARRVGSVLTGSVFEREEEGVEVSFPALADLKIAVHTYIIPKKISGKTIGELKIRSTTGATIIAISKKDRNIISPSPDTLLEEGDTVVVIGEKHQIENFEKMIR
jgi:TrkA domain protein